MNDAQKQIIRNTIYIILLLTAVVFTVLFIWPETATPAEEWKPPVMDVKNECLWYEGVKYKYYVDAPGLFQAEDDPDGTFRIPVDVQVWTNPEDEDDWIGRAFVKRKSTDLMQIFAIAIKKDNESHIDTNCDGKYDSKIILYEETTIVPACYELSGINL